MKQNDITVTPIRKQYLDIKSKHPDSILFFRLGDFYETFDEDAQITSRDLGIVLTNRKVSKHLSVPMAGIPYHSLENHLSKLVNKGHHVAICDQVGQEQVNGIMQRKVVRIFTPGTMTDPGMIPENRNSYLAAAYQTNEGAGLAYIDVSTGHFRATEFATEDYENQLINELNRISPKELLIPDRNKFVLETSNIHRTKIPQWVFETANSNRILLDETKVSTLAGFGIEEYPLAIASAAAIVYYLQQTQVTALELISGLSTYDTNEFMRLDQATRINLELTSTLRSGDKNATLLGTIDCTLTPMGGRLLHQFVQQPLINRRTINQRLDGVSVFFENSLLRSKLRKSLKSLGDMERLTNRVISGTANPHSLAAILANLLKLPEIKGLTTSKTLQSVAKDIDTAPDIVNLLQSALVDDPPANMNNSGFIRPGWSHELDKIIQSSKHALDWMSTLETTERERTGIKSLKVSFNKVFGYFIEVTKSSQGQVPDEYIRKQTLVNAERYITPELKEYENIVLDAEEKMLSIEKDIFSNLCTEVSKQADRLLKCTRALAYLDVLASLAETAASLDYVRPEIRSDSTLELRGSRHPVVEQHLSYGKRFVPNDCIFDSQDNIWIITGPNMSGKSTFLRQVALCVLLAQIGSFVPADSAIIGVVDRIFTRIGAQDEIHGGQSTFMVEMVETANILHHATPNSILILDEIGRGTSTYDGLSLAWSIVEHLHNNPELQSKTLFASHYHELLNLENKLAGVKNYNVAVSDESDSLVFTHRIVQGGADRSYGIHVAQLAGLPNQVITRAYELLSELENPNKNTKATVSNSDKHTENSPIDNNILEEFHNLEVDNLSPLQALQQLYKWKQQRSD